MTPTTTKAACADCGHLAKYHLSRADANDGPCLELDCPCRKYEAAR